MFIVAMARSFSDGNAVLYVLTVCGRRHVFTWWSEWTRIKDDAYVLSSSTGGGTGVKVWLLRLSCWFLW